ncbi:MAG: hypothetical protein HS101_08395 [Planctomycetia bacterium]|nr:hypothetical protein [Planctomycetia bacterium]
MARSGVLSEPGHHEWPSIASSRTGHYSVAWIGVDGAIFGEVKLFLTENQFDFDDFESIIPVESPPSSASGGGDEFPSAGASDALIDQATAAWANNDENPGLHFGIDGAQTATIRNCDVTTCGARVNQWLPCVSTRSEDGAFAIAFAYDEDPTLADSFLNIALVLFDETGAVLEQLAGPDRNDPDKWVNNPLVEDISTEDESNQVSPAVSFVGNDIVVAWAGPRLVACTGDPNFHIYARRFKFDDSAQPGQRLRDPADGEGRSGVFVVDTDANSVINNPLIARPALALTLATDSNAGRFVVAWNTLNNPEARTEIHAQYFDNLGQPRGSELRVNQDTSPTLSGNARYLQRSGGHTIAYGAEDQLVATWAHENTSGVPVVSYTVLPPNYARTTIPACGVCEMNPEMCDPCLKGDADNDCLVNLYDIAPFVDALLFGDFTCADILDVCRVDMNNDARINGLDIQCFVNTLVGNECTLPTLRIIDCNLNGIPDDEDIAAQTSSDVNSNGVPDECEPDCNENDVPDEWDIAQATSYDCDTDGIPDECAKDCNDNGIADSCDVDPADPDGNSMVSADCNLNGYPDECEPDCNTNGVPDDCDMDPTDPVGDEWVSPDCNGNEYPDECELALPPPFGSSDCNTNGIPDECDIADCESDPACDDCNENGIPDACDIAAEISEDVNTNGIPDECEGESLMGGGGESMMSSMSGEGDTGETPMPPDEEAAWEAFYEWSIAQCWGPNCESSTDAQFAAMIAKLSELGLPTAAVGP